MDHKFNYYKLGQNAGTGSVPTDFRLYGSNSVADNTYVLIDSRTAYDAHGTPDNPIVFKPNINVGTQQYQYLVFQVTKLDGGSGECNLRELAFGWI